MDETVNDGHNDGQISSGDYNPHGIRFFDEHMIHPKATALDAPKFIEFDWEILRRLLGEANDDMTASDYALVGDVMGELLRWIVRGDKLDLIGRRAVALAWVVNPDIFKGKSAAAVCKTFGFRKERMAEICSEVSRQFEVSNRAQDHGWNRKGNAQ